MPSFEPSSAGRVVATSEAGGFRIAECAYRPGEWLPTHVHEGASVTLLVDGTFREGFRSRSYDCVPGSVLVKPGGEPHENRYGPRGARCLVIEALGSRAEIVPFDRVRYAPPRTTRDLGSLLYQELQTRDDVSQLALEGLCLELVALLARLPELEPVEGAPPWLRRAAELLQDRFNEPLRLGELAASVGVHASQLSRTFRQTFGLTPSAFVRRRRVAWARQELVRTDRPLAEIALDAGFADQSHFTRCFVRVEGKSPLLYRKAARAKAPESIAF